MIIFLNNYWNTLEKNVDYYYSGITVILNISMFYLLTTHGQNSGFENIQYWKTSYRDPFYKLHGCDKNKVVILINTS